MWLPSGALFPCLSKAPSSLPQGIPQKSHPQWLLITYLPHSPLVWFGFVLQHWGWNQGLTLSCITSPSILIIFAVLGIESRVFARPSVLFCFEAGSHWSLGCQGWAPPFSASQTVEITGVCHCAQLHSSYHSFVLFYFFPRDYHHLTHCAFAFLLLFSPYAIVRSMKARYVSVCSLLCPKYIERMWNTASLNT